MCDGCTYRTFKRSARNWQEFANAKKIIEDKGLSFADAQARCQEFNNNRTPAQKRKGTKLEFERE